MANFNVHSIMVENDLEDCGLETVSQHRSAVVLLRFGSDLEGRRLRRPRYRGEDSPLLGIGEAPGGASASPPSFSRASVTERETHFLSQPLLIRVELFAAPAEFRLDELPELLNS